MSKIGKRILKEVQRIAAQSPDYRYEPPDSDQCVYIHDGEPSCIFGHALLNLGLIDKSFERVLIDIDGVSCARINLQDIETVIEYLNLEIDDKEIEEFLSIQSDQDNGKPWGRVVVCPASAA